MSQLLTTDEVATMLNLATGRVYELCRQGILPHVRLGRQIRFSREKIDGFISAGGCPLPKTKAKTARY